MDISIIILNYKTKKYLSACLNSIINQNTKFSYEIILINNSSTENLNDLITKTSQIRLITNEINLGFAAGNNQGIKIARGKYIFCLNADIVLEPNYIERGAKFMEKNTDIGALCGKMLLRNNKKILDSTGLIITRNRWIFDRGQGEKDNNQFNKTEEMFGASASAVIYRKQALDTIKMTVPPSTPLSITTISPPSPSSFAKASEGQAAVDSHSLHSKGGSEYFDKNFFMYKEDIDLSWRLRHVGWKIFYLPQIIAYHDRSSGVSSHSGSMIDILRNRQKTHSKKVNFLSFRNQRFMQIKNEHWQNILIDFPRIFIKELGIFIYLLIAEPYLLKAVWQIFTNLPKMLSKRKTIMAGSKVSWQDIRKWLQ